MTFKDGSVATAYEMHSLHLINQDNTIVTAMRQSSPSVPFT